jgi:NitT/TauT family transport system permease protein
MKYTVLKWLIILGFFLLWEFIPFTGIVDRAFLPPFHEVFASLWNLAISGTLFTHIAASALRLASGLGLACAIGLPLGIAMGHFKKLERVVDSLLQAGRQVSALALFPVFILFFGIGELSKSAIIAWASLWPVLLNAIGGVKNIDPLLVRAARSMGARGPVLFAKVILPAAAPSVFTGLRLAAAYGFMVLVAAEMIGANAGLGFLVLNSQEVFRIPEMYAAIVVLAGFGLGVNKVLLVLEKRLRGNSCAAQ